MFVLSADKDMYLNESTIVPYNPPPPPAFSPLSTVNYYMSHYCE